VQKIRYENGYIDWLGNEKDSAPGGSPQIEVHLSGVKKYSDTLNHSIIYILFNSGQDESQKVPLYINGTYVATLKNHMRLTYKVYSEGLFTIERRGGGKNSQDEPVTTMTITRGHFYGIRIQEPYPWALKPNKKFRFTPLFDVEEVNTFLANEFNAFKPFEKNDLHLTEGKEQIVK
jgi:hypothetical protein